MIIFNYLRGLNFRKLVKKIVLLQYILTQYINETVKKKSNIENKIIM